jgi:hypothetical protein
MKSKNKKSTVPVPKASKKKGVHEVSEKRIKDYGNKKKK